MVVWLSPAAFTLATAAALLSCGGGGVSTTPVSPLPSPTPILIPIGAPVTVVQQQTVGLPAASPGATPVAVQLPAAAGFSPVMLLPLPQIATNTQLTVLVSNVAPSSSPPLSLERLAQAVRRTAALPPRAAVLLYNEIYSTAALVLPTAPGFTFTLPAADVFANANYYLALYDPTRPSLGWQYGFEGPATVSGSTLAFAANSATFTLAANLAYYFALYVIPQAAAQPTPAPSISPTSVPTQSPPPITESPPPASVGNITIAVPTPSPVLCTPAPVAVTVGQTVLITCAAQGYIGRLSVAIADPNIASIHQNTPQTLTDFNVTGLAAGTTTLTVQTQPGGMGTVAITVSP